MTLKEKSELPRNLLMQMVLCALSVVCLLYFPMPILSELAQIYQISPLRAADSLSAFGFAYASGFLAFGALSDRLGRKIVMLGGLISLTLITFCLIFVTDWQVFIGLRIAQGLSASAFPPVALAYLSERGTPAQKMWAIAWMSTAFLSAGILGQIYALEITGAYGLGWMLAALALVYLSTSLRLIFINNETTLLASKSWYETYKPLLFLYQNFALRRVYLSALLLLFCFVSFYLALDAYLGESLVSQGISKLQMRLVALPVFALTLFTPKLIAYFKAPQKVVSLGLGLASAGLFLAALCAFVAPIWILASSLIFVAGIAMSVPALIARTASATVPEMRGVAVSFYTFVLFVGASLAPYFIRAVAGFSLKMVFLWLAGLLLCALAYNMKGQKG